MSQFESTKVVPYEGPKNGYNILLVGEAPGAEEVGQGRPFVGRSGQLLERYLNRAGVGRSKVKLANLCRRRPRGNKFEYILKTDELQEDLDLLEEEVKRVRPNVIVALGNWPVWFLTGACGSKNNKPQPGSGILLYRGSRLPALERFGGESQKVFCSLHPAAVVREWGWNPVFFTDLNHAVEDSAFPELKYPEYDEFIDPDVDVAQALLHEALSAPWISVDIETFPGRYSCVGWSWQTDGRDRAMCMTYQKAFLLERFAKEMWESDTPKIFQYGTYDISFMRNFYGWKIGGYYDKVGWDTYVASASILPDFPRKLDFLCSIYTRFPYYKSERKVWKEGGDMMTLWKYNVKDVVATMHIALKQMEEIKELFG